MAAHLPADKLAYVDAAAQLGYAPDAGPTWLRPIACQPLAGLCASLSADHFLPLAGGWTGFTHLDVVTGDGQSVSGHGAPILPAIHLPAQIRTRRSWHWIFSASRVRFLQG